MFLKTMNCKNYCGLLLFLFALLQQVTAGRFFELPSPSFLDASQDPSMMVMETSEDGNVVMGFLQHNCENSSGGRRNDYFVWTHGGCAPSTPFVTLSSEKNNFVRLSGDGNFVVYICGREGELILRKKNVGDIARGSPSFGPSVDLSNDFRKISDLEVSRDGNLITVTGIKVDGKPGALVLVGKDLLIPFKRPGGCESLLWANPLYDGSCCVITYSAPPFNLISSALWSPYGADLPLYLFPPVSSIRSLDKKSPEPVPHITSPHGEVFWGSFMEKEEDINPTLCRWRQGRWPEKIAPPLELKDVGFQVRTPMKRAADPRRQLFFFITESSVIHYVHWDDRWVRVGEFSKWSCDYTDRAASDENTFCYFAREAVTGEWCHVRVNGSSGRVEQCSLAEMLRAVGADLSRYFLLHLAPPVPAMAARIYYISVYDRVDEREKILCLDFSANGSSGGISKGETCF